MQSFHLRFVLIREYQGTQFLSMPPTARAPQPSQAPQAKPGLTGPHPQLLPLLSLPQPPALTSGATGPPRLRPRQLL